MQDDSDSGMREMGSEEIKRLDPELERSEDALRRC